MIIIDKYPDTGEVVQIKVTKILSYGAFCRIEEYNNLEAFLHISEVSSGWVKNIHEYLNEGRTYVAKISRINREKMLFDVSLKRVSEKEKKMKMEEVSKDRRANKLIELVSKELKANPNDIRVEILKGFEVLYEYFDAVAEADEESLAKVTLPEGFLERFKGLASVSAEKKEVVMSRVVELVTSSKGGIDNLKDLVSKLLAKSPMLEVKYLGAPKYLLRIKAKTPKDADKELTRAIRAIDDCKTVKLRAQHDTED